jgi:hypothetical protein
VEQPTDRELLYIIHRTVERVIRYGAQFEVSSSNWKYIIECRISVFKLFFLIY